MDNRILRAIDTLNDYFKKYLVIDTIRYEDITSDISVLDKAIDALIDLQRA